MYRITAIVILSVVAFGAFAVDSPAQVRYTFPSAQVEVGPPGIRIQTPFWSGYFPAPPIRPPFPFPFRRGRVIISPAPTVVQPRVVTPAPETPPVVVPDKKQSVPPKFVAPAPTPVPKKNEAKRVRPQTIQEFAKTFQPKQGHYQVVLLNPINGAATTVRFSLPEGTPKNVRVAKNSVEFRYGLRRYVRIEFDQEGAIVISR